jgi:hypothetical protein
MVNSNNFAASIPIEMHQAFERTLLNYRKVEYDKMLCRNLSTIRPVGPTIQTDVVTTWEKTGGNDTLIAKITAKGAAPDEIGLKSAAVSHPMYQVSVKFTVNERDLSLDPALQTRKAEVATAEIRRLEDYIWFNGNTSPSITGMAQAAALNPQGCVPAYGTSVSGTNNVASKGNWRPGDDTYRDIYDDVLEAVTRIDDNFDAKFLVGKKIDIAPIRKMDDLRNRYSDQILDLFGAGSTKDFIRTSAYCPAGYVFVVAKDMEFEEFVISEDLRVDTAIGKDEGGNFPVVLREWVSQEVHKPGGVTSIYTL